MTRLMLCVGKTFTALGIVSSLETCPKHSDCASHAYESVVLLGVLYFGMCFVCVLLILVKGVAYRKRHHATENESNLYV